MTGEATGLDPNTFDTILQNTEQESASTHAPKQLFPNAYDSDCSVFLEKHYSVYFFL